MNVSKWINEEVTRVGFLLGSVSSDDLS